jgi:hypothetical protein
MGGGEENHAAREMSVLNAVDQQPASSIWHPVILNIPLPHHRWHNRSQRPVWTPFRAKARNFGFRISRNPSPKKLKDKTASMVANPGNSTK